MTDDLISIVLPVHNGARYLASAIESCLAQTWRNLELIVVDDASTDETPGIAADYAALDPRVRVITHSKNVRLPEALNSGFGVASGAFFTWTSDDNRYRPEALAVMHDYLAAHPEVGLVYADCTYMDDEGREIWKRRVPEWSSAIETNPVGACFLYRREVHDRVGKYDRTMFLSEDYDYWLRISKYYPIHALHQDLYWYRNHADSLTSRWNERRIRFVAARALARNLPDLPWITPRLKAQAYYVIAGYAWRAGKYGHTLAYLWRSACAHSLRMSELAMRRGVEKFELPP